MLKADLRKLYRAERMALSDIDWQQRCQAIRERLMAFLTKRFTADTPLTLHTFLPIRRQREVDTYSIIARLRQHYPHVRIVISSSRPDGSMVHVTWSDTMKLIENRWGIPEPAEPYLPLITSTEIDVVLVPLLAFDKQGHRVGYGKGYYDRFLAGCRTDVLTIGLSLFEPTETIFDIGIMDISLTACVTPYDDWYFFNNL